jgi:hypothetical protein
MKPPYFRLTGAAIFLLLVIFAAGFHTGRWSKPAEVIEIQAYTPAGACIPYMPPAVCTGCEEF